MGIRIEVRITLFLAFRRLLAYSHPQDEVLIGKDDPIVLSVNAPKEVWGLLITLGRR
jgi:hypothetical protein